MSLRPYQINAVEKIRKLFSSGEKKVLLHLATGSGKTVIFCHLVKSVQAKNKSAMIVVRGRKLVDQASKRLEKEGVDHGVLMAGHKKYNESKKIFVASIDTITSRDLKPEADLIIIDEAHQATAYSYTELAKNYPKSFFLSVTATPYSDKPIRHVANQVVSPISVQQLIDQKYLVPAKYYAPSSPNLKGIKTTAGDYNEKQLAEIMDKPTLTGSIVEHWKKIALGRPTIAFCVNVEHSKNLCDSLNQNGIRAEHIDANSSDEERQAAIDRLVDRKIDILSNCGILCTGVDIEPVSCIIMARPTKSLNLFIQQAGRGTRIFPGKNDFIILDHAGNTLRHGFITDKHEAQLDGKEKTKKNIINVKTCKICYAVYQGAHCSDCGPQESIAREINHVAGNLIELDPDAIDPYVIETKKIIEQVKQKKQHHWRVHYILRERHGEYIANEYYPKGRLAKWKLREALKSRK